MVHLLDNFKDIMLKYSEDMMLKYSDDDNLSKFIHDLQWFYVDLTKQGKDLEKKYISLSDLRVLVEFFKIDKLILNKLICRITFEYREIKCMIFLDYSSYHYCYIECEEDVYNYIMELSKKNKIINKSIGLELELNQKKERLIGFTVNKDSYSIESFLTATLKYKEEDLYEKYILSRNKYVNVFSLIRYTKNLVDFYYIQKDELYNKNLEIERIRKLEDLIAYEMSEELLKEEKNKKKKKKSKKNKRCKKRNIERKDIIDFSMLLERGEDIIEEKKEEIKFSDVSDLSILYMMLMNKN